LRAVRVRGALPVVGVAELRARDGDVCGICWDVIDFDLVFPDRGAAVVDHAVALCLGGSDHPDNLHLAHNWCNSVKGASEREDPRRRIA
jgi:5-methylcytosine-specific restriction endonuclease McrA